MKPRDWLILLLLGMVSAIISVAIPSVSNNLELTAQGAVFGTAICAFLVDQRRLRFFPDALAVIGVAMLACWSSLIGIVFAVFTPWPSRLPPLPVPFACGVAGGLVLLTALFALAFPKGKILQKVTFGVLVSGLLGVLGYLSAPVLGRALWRLLPNSSSPEYVGSEGFWDYSTFFVWQVCMAIYIGYATQSSSTLSEAQSPSYNAGQNSERWMATRATTLSIPLQRKARNALVAALGVCFAVVMVSTSRNRRERAVQEAFDQSVWTQMPPAVHLTDVRPLLPEEVLVLSDIGRLHAGQAQLKYERAIDLADERQPNSICYTAEYAPDGAVTMPAVVVSVSEYPNDEWPQFLAKYDAPIGLPPRIKPLTEKFGNKMRTDGAHILPRGLSVHVRVAKRGKSGHSDL
jgi:hypothetical protein